MERFRGILQIRLCNAGSRSEGRFAFLTSEGNEDLKVCRKDASPSDDPFFEDFDGKEVEINGEESHGWITADEIMEITDNNDEI